MKNRIIDTIINFFCSPLSFHPVTPFNQKTIADIAKIINIIFSSIFNIKLYTSYLKPFKTDIKSYTCIPVDGDISIARLVFVIALSKFESPVEVSIIKLYGIGT